MAHLLIKFGLTIVMPLIYSMKYYFLSKLKLKKKKIVKECVLLGYEIFYK